MAVGVTVNVGEAVYVSVMVYVGVTVCVSVNVWDMVCVSVMVQVGDMVGVSVGELFCVPGVITKISEPLNLEISTPLSRFASPTSVITICIMFPVEPGGIGARVVKSGVEPLYCIPSAGEVTTSGTMKNIPFIMMGIEDQFKIVLQVVDKIPF